MGRRKKGRALDEKVCIRLTKEQKEILEVIADYSGLEVTDLVRSLVVNLILKFKLGIPIALPEVGEDEGNVPVPEEEEA